MLNKRWLSAIALVGLSLCAIIGYVYFAKYHAIYDKHVEEIAKASHFQLEITSRGFQRLESQVNSLIKGLDGDEALANFVADPSEDSRRYTESAWGLLTDYQSTFKQLSYLNLEGNELLKVGFSPDHELQNYKLPPAEQIKGGKVTPFATKVLFLNPGSTILTTIQYVLYPYTMGRERVGYILVGFDTGFATSSLDFSAYPEFYPHVLTDSGDYLLNTDPSKQFGFAIKERAKYNLSLTHSKLWQEMNARKAGYIQLDNGLYVFKNISLNSQSYYGLISFSHQQIEAQVADEQKELLQNAIHYLLMLALIAIPVCYFFYQQKKVSLDSKLALAALNGMSAVLICDNQYRVIKANKEFENITGFIENQIRYGHIGKLFFSKGIPYTWSSITSYLDSDGFWEGELTLQGRAGIELITITRIQAILDLEGRATNYIVSLVDISERKELEERLRYFSERDDLSQLWNRRKFDQELQNEVQLVKRYPANHISCLAILDIDHFKRVNDELGHDVGDSVIRRVSQKIKESTRQTDFTARIGGEEFAIIMPHTSLEDAKLVLDRLRVAVAEDPQCRTTVSIGFTDITDDSKRSYKWADVALYDSKSSGRNLVSLCRSDDDIA